MPTLLMLSGLPASGKSTVARQLVAEKDYARINRDDLRAMLFSSKWTAKREKYVVEIEKSLAAYFLGAGQNVVVDDTNLTQSHLDMWRAHAKQCGAEFSVQKLDVSLRECIERDAKRTVGHVGVGVIENMALRAGMIEWDDRQIVIVDVDGTLADGSHRRHFVDGEKKDWKAYFDAMAYDEARSAVCAWVRALAPQYCMVVVTGRPANYAGDTCEWLRYVAYVTWDRIFMRGTGDTREDTIIKQEILDRLPKEKIAFCIDDRPRLVRMWRANGLRCFDVGEGVEF